jgi:serine/threonine protein kinase
MSSREQRKILREGKLLGRFSIIRLIGQGGYGDIYESLDTRTQTHYAMKVERIAVHRQALERELDIIRLLERSPFYPQFICYDETPKYRYLVMELCGPSFSTVRRWLPSHCFSLSTIIRIAYEMVRALENFHSFGILHRDIKPSNFLIRPSRKYPVALIDYGLSRRYVDPITREPVPERPNPGFVGTGKYASLNAHAGKELGRRDDLCSWFYSLIEMWQGHLPWPAVRDRLKIYGAKRGTDIMRVIQQMPPAMTNVWKLIRRLQRTEEPDYPLIRAFLVQALDQAGGSWEDPYEWEDGDVSEISAIALIPPEGEERDPVGELPPPVLPPRPVEALGAEPPRARNASSRIAGADRFRGYPVRDGPK